MAGSFLQKSRHGTVYFRRKIPNDLRDIIGRPQVYISLNTQNRVDALLAARRWAAQFDGLFAVIRGMDDKEKFKASRLGQLIDRQITTAPLKERIEELQSAHIYRIDGQLHSSFATGPTNAKSNATGS